METVRDVMEAGKGKAPGFGFVRHLLAVLILLDHSYKIAVGSHLNDGYDKNDFLRQAGHLTIGQSVVELLRPAVFALVGAFFVLSGFLVYGSALRNPKLKEFLALRVIRILPALIVEVTLSALLIGPLVTQLPLSRYFADPGFWSYFENIVGLIHFNLPGVFATNPTPHWVNINLWTLPSEFECYAVLAVLLAARFTRNRWLMLLGMTVASIAILSLAYYGRFDLRGSSVSYGARFLVYLYMIGVLAYMFAEFIPLHMGLFMLCAAGFYCLTIANVSDVYAAPLLAYLTLYLGCYDFSAFDRVIKGDYSYGIYLYGFPIAQMIVYYLGDHIHSLSSPGRIAVVSLLTLVVTFLVAYASWHLVERRSLRLRHIFVRKPSQAKHNVPQGAPPLRQA